MNYFTKIYAKNGINKKNVEELENVLSVGLDASTSDSKNKKIINDTKKDIYLDVRIKNKESFELKCQETNNSIRNLIARCWTKNKTALYDGKIYYTENGYEESVDDSYYAVKVEGCEDMEAEMKLRKKNLNEVCKKYNIDASKYYYSEVQISRAIFYQNVKYLHGCEHVTPKEALFLDGSFLGALNYANKNKAFTDGYTYDINSFYPHVLCKTDFSFPLDTGFYRKNNKKYPLEIKRLTINGTHKYWKDTPNDYYDTYQIELLDLLKIPYTVEDEEKLCYRQPVKSEFLFSYFEELFEMKLKGNTHAKLILNTTHGQLSKKKKFEIDANDLKDCDKHKVVEYIEHRNVFVLQESEPYKFAFGRIKSFLHSYVRLCLIRDYVLPLETRGAKIYKINTDSILTNIKPSEMVLSKDLGGLKLEKTYKGNWRVKDTKTVLDENIF
jgi:hypothetical protein